MPTTNHMWTVLGLKLVHYVEKLMYNLQIYIKIY